MPITNYLFVLNKQLFSFHHTFCCHCNPFTLSLACVLCSPVKLLLATMVSFSPKKNLHIKELAPGTLKAPRTSLVQLPNKPSRRHVEVWCTIEVLVWHCLFTAINFAVIKMMKHPIRIHQSNTEFIEPTRNLYHFRYVVTTSFNDCNLLLKLISLVIKLVKTE